ncbi:MAG: hypothetical protein B7X57_09665, partial [Erythrobacter sp. 34-65-8]
MNKLEEICATKQTEVAQRQAEQSVTALDHLAAGQSPPRGFGDDVKFLPENTIYSFTISFEPD